MDNEEARSSIQDLLYRYARGVDRREWELVRSCYHTDAVDHHGGYVGNRDGLIEWMKVRHETIRLSMHFISNILVDFRSADTARVESYCVTVQRMNVSEAGESLKMYDIPALDDTLSGEVIETEVRCRFVDLVTSRNDEWRVLRRTVVFESLDYRSFVPTSLGENLVAGSRHPDDPLWSL